MKVEELIKKYDAMAGDKGQLPDDLVATIMINVCHKELRDHLELSTKEMTRDDARIEIFNYIERKRTNINQEFVAMEIDNFESDNSWEYDYGWSPCYDGEQYEELNFFGKGKGGKFGGKGSWKGGKGGKQGGGKFGGKGGWKGGDPKGKGKSSVTCFWCGKTGHTQAYCHAKDAYMNEMRAKNGEQGGEKEHLMGSCDHASSPPAEKPAKGGEIANMEAHALAGQTYRYLSSFECKNAFSSLNVADGFEDAFPAGPPGLQPGKG